MDNKEIISQNNERIKAIQELLKTKTVSGQYNVETNYNEDGTQTLVVSAWDYIPSKYDRILANNTPAQISEASAEISQNGYTSAQVERIYGWRLGDTLRIPLSYGENIEVRIIGINHDTLSSDHTTKAGITFDMTHIPYLLDVCDGINTTSTNAGGYPASNMRNNIIPQFKTYFPQEWQDVIKFVDKKSANGGGANYTQTVTSSEDLFILSEIELTGDGTNAQDGENEGTVYEYWNGRPMNDRAKKWDADEDGIPEAEDIYWLRSASLNSTENFRYVSGAGNLAGAIADASATGTCCASVAFCV